MGDFRDIHGIPPKLEVKWIAFPLPIFLVQLKFHRDNN